MIKICSLEFLNKETFDTDVFAQNGEKLFSANDKPTPEILLGLYFKEIYVKEPLAVDEVLNFEEELVQTQDLKEEEPEGKDTTPLEFDEQQAKRIVDYSLIIAKAINLPEENKLELEKAAYYLFIGRKKLTQADLNSKEFINKQADASYDIMTTEMKFKDKIAQVAKMYFRKYNFLEFPLENDSSKTPYHHIVAIASYYDGLISAGYKKEDALRKMVKIGGNRFNIFILHKFVNMMRNENENE